MSGLGSVMQIYLESRMQIWDAELAHRARTWAYIVGDMVYCMQRPRHEASEYRRKCEFSLPDELQSLGLASNAEMADMFSSAGAMHQGVRTARGQELTNAAGMCQCHCCCAPMLSVEC